VAFLRTEEQVQEKVTSFKKWGAVLISVLFGLVILAAAGQFGLTTHALINLPTLALLTIAAIVDIQRKMIPDWLTLPGLAWALVASAFFGWPRLSDALLGVILCGGALLLFALISRGSIGGGDVKLMAMIGASLGWRWGFGVLAFAQLAAAGLAICLLITRRKGRKDALPFGPFLAAFAVLAILGKPMQ
jgi:prepilin signal peptidase PulO-like enzyme (type II secretory pathway)